MRESNRRQVRLDATPEEFAQLVEAGDGCLETDLACPTDARGPGDARLRALVARERYPGRQQPAAMLVKLRQALGQRSMSWSWPLAGIWCSRWSR
jgi:hypothetical protein